MDEQHFPLGLEFDQYGPPVSCLHSILTEYLNRHDIDTSTAHFLVRLTPSLEPIGTIRIFPNPSVNATPEHAHHGKPLPKLTYELGRLCVSAAYRKHGFGSVLVDAAHTWVKEQMRKHDQSATSLTGSLRGNFETLDDGTSAEIILHAQIPAMPFYMRFASRCILSSARLLMTCMYVT